MDCCKTFLTDQNILVNTLYKGLSKYYDNTFEKIYSSEVFGKSCVSYDSMMNLHYLTMLYGIIYRDIQVDAGVHDKDYFFEKYSLQCIIDKFRCNNADIKPLIDKLFEVKDGVDFMQISGSGPTPPPFIVR